MEKKVSKIKIDIDCFVYLYRKSIACMNGQRHIRSALCPSDKLLLLLCSVAAGPLKGPLLLLLFRPLLRGEPEHAGLAQLFGALALALSLAKPTFGLAKPTFGLAKPTFGLSLAASDGGGLLHLGVPLSEGREVGLDWCRWQQRSCRSP